MTWIAAETELHFASCTCFELSFAFYHVPWIACRDGLAHNSTPSSSHPHPNVSNIFLTTRVHCPLFISQLTRFIADLLLMASEASGKKCIKSVLLVFDPDCRSTQYKILVKVYSICMPCTGTVTSFHFVKHLLSFNQRGWSHCLALTPSSITHLLSWIGMSKVHTNPQRNWSASEQVAIFASWW